MNLKSMFDTQAGWGMTIVRIAAGIIYMGHGLPKTGWISERTFDGTVQFVGSLGFPMPTLFAGLVTAAEVVGGLMLILGLLTRASALTQVIAMLAAVFLYHFDNGIMGMFAKGGYQWAFLLCACSAALMVEGAGKASLDKMIADKMS
jgi:putative oxidoreductase